MLCGAKPFDKPTPIATAMSHIHDAPPPLPEDAPEALAGVIEDMLAKDPADRPRTLGRSRSGWGSPITRSWGWPSAWPKRSTASRPWSRTRRLRRTRSPEEPTATLAVDPAALLDDWTQSEVPTSGDRPGVGHGPRHRR